MKSVNLLDQIARVQPTEKFQSQATRQAVNEQEIAKLQEGKTDDIKNTTAQETKGTEHKELEREKYVQEDNRRHDRNQEQKQGAKQGGAPLKKKLKKLDGGSIIDTEA
ncbi:MAG: hypothetical protein ABIA63_07835 [bacterium]